MNFKLGCECTLLLARVQWCFISFSDFKCPTHLKKPYYIKTFLMTQLLIRCLSICALLLPPLFLSACADVHQSADHHLSENQELLGLVPSDGEDPDSDISTELEALRRAGNWSRANNASLNQNLLLDTNFSDFPIVLNNQVQAYLDLFQNQQKKSFSIWLSRSGKYLPMMQKELKDAGLPEDLAYLAMIESGYNQKAYSKANASGLWQFIPGTGSQYNLKMNKYIDERREAMKSTKAAVKFLSNLYDDFGDWHLAVAAYNAGPGKISKGLERYNVTDFWSLAENDYLAMETKRYVPKLIASIIIAKNPEKFGFKDVQMEEPYSYDTLEVGPGLTFDAAALISNCDRKTIDLLNPELCSYKTPPNQGTHQIKIPAGSKDIASKNLSRLHQVVSTDYKTHTISKGETLAQVCSRYDISTTTLLKVNNLRSPKLASGQRLRIPFQNVRYQLLAEGSTKAVASAGLQDNPVLHKVQKGESVLQIARKYNVSVELIASWNNLPASNKVNAGQRLSLFLDSINTTSQPPQDNPVVASTPKDQTEKTPVIVATQTKKMPTRDNVSKVAVNTIQKGDTDKSRANWYEVQDGDTLYTIAKEFKLSPLQIKQLNNLQSNVILPGKRLKIKDV
jgi:membrane-bound lytic murein transglycosylase D